MGENTAKLWAGVLRCSTLAKPYSEALSAKTPSVTTADSVPLPPPELQAKFSDIKLSVSSIEAHRDGRFEVMTVISRDELGNPAQWEDPGTKFAPAQVGGCGTLSTSVPVCCPAPTAAQRRGSPTCAQAAGSASCLNLRPRPVAQVLRAELRAPTETCVIEREV